MKAKIINIGNELLNGHTLNSNAYFLGKELSALGVEVLEAQSILDGKIPLHKALAETDSDCVLITGGLGPTQDDTTRYDFASFFGVECVFTPSAQVHIESILGDRATTFKEENKTQCYLPEGASFLDNPLGTALGMHYVSSAGVHYFLMPGVPYEMHKIFKEQVAPKLESSAEWNLQEWLTFGLGESKLNQVLQTWKPSEGFAFASLPSLSGLLIRLSSRIYNKESVEWNNAVAELEGLLPAESVVGVNKTLLDVVEALFIKNELTLSLAESCTAGLLGSILGERPGVSSWFQGGVISYSNDVKSKCLKVSSKTIAQNGAVSEEVALEMATGVKDLLNTEASIAISGIAGPTGGSPEKPLGTVSFGICFQEHCFSITKIFRGGRQEVRKAAAYFALNELRKLILINTQKSTCTSEQ